MDSDRVEARKSLLESFLKVSILLFWLCSHSNYQIPNPSWRDLGTGIFFEVCLVSFAATLCHSGDR